MVFASNKRLKKLKALGDDAPVLSSKGLLSPRRIKNFSQSCLNLKLLYSTEKIDDSILMELCLLAEEMEVVGKMSAMQRLEVANFVFGVECENREVGHVAVRHLYDQDFCSAKEKEAAGVAMLELDKLKKFLISGSTSFCKHVVVVGIGGSYLGTQAVWEALRYYRSTQRTLDFISNIDPDNLAAVVERVDLEQSLIVIISKSGATLEVRTNEELLRAIFKKRGLDTHKHFVAVTEPGSPLDDPSSFLESFYMSEHVGGRFSVSSMVGVVPLALALGIEVVEDFLRGMSAMDKVSLNPDPMKNMPLLIALLTVWNRNFLNIPTVSVVCYSSALSRYSAHLQQLFMESNGKSTNQRAEVIDYPTSAIYWGEIGTDAQHSFFQYLHQGSDSVSVEFVAFGSSQCQTEQYPHAKLSQDKLLSNVLAQSLCLALGKHSHNGNRSLGGDRSNRIIFGARLDPQTMGQLVALHEHVAVFIGFLLDINSFDQEGVQLGKTLAARMIKLMQNARSNQPQPTDADSLLAIALIDQINGEL